MNAIITLTARRTRLAGRESSEEFVGRLRKSSGVFTDLKNDQWPLLKMVNGKAFLMEGPFLEIADPVTTCHFQKRLSVSRN